MLGDRLREYINEEYDGTSVPVTYCKKTIVSNVGICEVGLACIMKKGLPFKIKVFCLDKDYIVLQLYVEPFRVILINVYVRSVTWERRTLDKYLQEVVCLGTYFN